MKKILIVQPIHEKGMELLKSNSNYTYEVVEDLSVNNVKQKIIDADALSLRTSILPAGKIDVLKDSASASIIFCLTLLTLKSSTTS